MGFLDKLLPPGKMKIQLEKLEFNLGDTVSGTIFLEMKKPLQARALKVKVISEETVRQRSGGSTTTKTNTLFEFE